MTDDLDGVVDAYERAAAAGDTYAMLNLGNVLADEFGQFDDAVGWYERAIYEGDARGLIDLGIVLERKGDLEAAEARYREAIEADEPRGHVKLGYLMKVTGDGDGAEREYRQAATLGVTEAWAYLGWLHSDSCLRVLQLLIDLGFALDRVDAAGLACAHPAPVQEPSDERGAGDRD